MIRRFLLVAVAVLLVSPRADAAPINLLLTTDVEPTTVGPQALGFSYMFWESATNDWLTDGSPDRRLLSGGATLMPGQTQFEITLDVDSLATDDARGVAVQEADEPNVIVAGPSDDLVDGDWHAPPRPAAPADAGGDHCTRAVRRPERVAGGAGPRRRTRAHTRRGGSSIGC